MADDAQKQTEAEAKVSEQKAGARVTMINPQNVPSIYINNAHVSLGSLEVRLHLSEMAPGPDGSIVVTERLCVIMAPEFVKFMAERLIKTMEQFEKQIGKLRHLEAEDVPPTVIGAPPSPGPETSTPPKA